MKVNCKEENLRFSPEGEPRKIFVDIDETICFFPTKRMYDLAEPNYKNIAKINKLYDEGNIITYWTARGSSQPDNEERMNHYKELTNKQLMGWGCKFHNLELGTKPQFDLLIDDKVKRIEEV
jgi:hypothetical protein